uniref:FERM, ARHGEF and pleckstrin domain-containing protein 1 n=1 Tax=Cyprinus carpio TaxID=7962 RepID=A0A8C2A882_CYPCA
MLLGVSQGSRPSVAGQRLGAPESMGISTLEPGQRPPTMPPGRQVSIRVQMLDDTQEVFEVSVRHYLLSVVFIFLFYCIGHWTYIVWLDLLKPTLKQIRRPKNTILRFVVKFFPPDHSQLLEELTRYLFALQIKHDLACGRLTCNESSAALLVSHIVQSEIGDFDEVQCKQHLLNNKYIPEQDALMDKIIEYHRKHVGQTPAESDYQLLEIARRLEMYGVRLYPAKDREGTKLSLAVAHSGVLVFQGHTKINAFNWSKVRKLSFKRKRFLIKLRPDLNVSAPLIDTLEFMMGSRDCCKVFWKICVEYHAFFRLFEEPKPKPKPVLFTRGSSFRFSESPSAGQVMVNGQKQSLSLGQSPDRRQPSPLTSPLLTDAGFVRTDDEDEVRRKRFPTDKAYFIAKELLTTERTYLKDLEVITVSFQKSVGKDEAMPDSLRNLIFANFEPVYKFHETFLNDVEQRLAQWEGRSNAHIKGDYQRVGDVMLKNIQGLKLLTAHLQKHSEALLELERTCRSSRRLEGLCRDFELQKVCYLPLNIFFLRPLHRLMHYKQILERLCKHYPPTHDDFRDSRAALADISEMVVQLHGTLIKMENFQKLLELKKDLTGVDDLAIPGREFIRLGCLSKLSGKGLQQRMFFLFNDVLMYTSRGMTASNQFKVNGQLPMYGMTVGNILFISDHNINSDVSFKSEMEKWVEDIKMAIELADKCNGSSAEILSSSFTDSKSPEESSADQESEDDLSASRTSLERQTPHRGNTTVHVCWHRNTSVSMVDFSVALENQLSGNLLRKFKNSNGWQKLWVVFTNFSLFFYKTHQDEFPLASLPLLGYSITVPSESENIHKDYVFKLHFKSHVYYFRSESEYSFERYSTNTNLILFRMDSTANNPSVVVLVT